MRARCCGASRLHGVDVGDRWQRLVEAWEPRIDDAWYSFNDTHAMMSFVGAGRSDLRREAAGGHGAIRAAG